MSRLVNRFWIVMREATYPVRVPQAGYVRHNTKAIAEAEAQRLASKYKEPFVVLGVEAAFAPVEVQRLALR